MPDPAELIGVAKLLSNAGGPAPPAGAPPTDAPPTDAHMRRAASTAYYAVFHMLLRAAADRFMGAGQAAAPGYSLLYRGFSHGQMRRACEELQHSTLKERYKRALQRTAVSRDMQAFARSFPNLQDARHTADYDPAAQFSASDVAALIQEAENAIEAFDRAPPDEQADVLALLMMGIRN